MRLLALLPIILLVSCFAKSAKEFDIVDPASIITLTASRTIEQADGFSIVDLTVQIPKKTDTDKRTIVFKTSAGLFVDTGTNTTSVSVNADGSVTVQLRAPTSPSTALVSADVANTYKQTVTIQFQAVSSVNSLTLTPPSSPTLIADGASIIQVQVVIPTGAQGDARSVTLTTTAGVFVDNGLSSITIKLGTSNSLSVPIKSPGIGGNVYVTAATNQFRQTISLSFVNAPVEKIAVDPGTFTIQAGLDKQTTVTAQLLRSTGIPSPNIDVQFQAFDSTGTRTLNQGQFRALTQSNSLGIVTAIYTAGNTPYRGKTVLKASVYSGIISGTATVTVINP